MVCYDRTIFGRYTTVTVVQLLLRMCFEPKFTAYFRKTENSLFLIKNTCILCNRKPIKSLSCPITSKLFWNTVITSFSHRNIELDHNSLYKIERVRVEQALIDVLKVWNFMKRSFASSPAWFGLVQKATSCLSVESLLSLSSLPVGFPRISYIGNFRSCPDSSAETRLHYWCPLLDKQRETERRKEREEVREWLSDHAISPFIGWCRASPRGTIRKPNYFPPLQPLLPLACCYFFITSMLYSSSFDTSIPPQDS